MIIIMVIFALLPRDNNNIITPVSLRCKCKCIKQFNTHMDRSTFRHSDLHNIIYRYDTG